MNIEEGKYIIRCFCFLNDDSTFSYLSGPPVAPRDQTVEESMTTCIYATVKNIVRADMREKIKERHLEPECFVQVIRRDNGTILLRQTATGRYATVNTQQTYSFMAGQEGDDPAPKISFFRYSRRPPAEAAEFKLIAPTGDEADGVALLSMKNGCYVEISAINYLHPVCERISQLPDDSLFVFERRFGYF